VLAGEESKKKVKERERVVFRFGKETKWRTKIFILRFLTDRNPRINYG